MRTFYFFIGALTFFVIFIGCTNKEKTNQENINNSSAWILESEENPFDGKVNIAYLEAENSESATLIINYHEKISDYNLYFTGIGNSRCDNKILRFAFDDEDEIYSARGITNNSGSEWFIYSPLDRFQVSALNGDYLSQEELLLFLTYYNKATIRFESDCGVKDYNFSIKGSEKIINDIIGDAIDLDEIARKRKEKIQKEKSFELIYTGEEFDTVLSANGYVRDEPKYSAIVGNNRFEKGAKIRIKDCSPNPSYCKVVTYKNEGMPGNKTYYVHIDALDLTQLSAVE